MNKGGARRPDASGKRAGMGLFQSKVDQSNMQAWAPLLDLGEIEAACAMLADAGAVPSEGSKAADSLTRHFLGPLRMLLDAMPGPPGSFAAGEGLFMRGHMLAMRLDHGARLSAGDVADFRLAWLEFVAAVGGVAVYHDWSALKAQRVAAAQAARGDAASLTPEVLARWLRARGQDRVTSGRDGNLFLIVDQFKVGEATVWRRLKEARAAGLLP